MASLRSQLADALVSKSAPAPADGSLQSADPPQLLPLPQSLPLPLVRHVAADEDNSTEQFLRTEHEARQQAAFEQGQRTESCTDMTPPHRMVNSALRSDHEADPDFSSQGTYAKGDILPMVAWDVHTPPRDRQSARRPDGRQLADEILLDRMTPPSPVAATPSPPKFQSVKVIDVIGGSSDSCYPLPRMAPTPTAVSAVQQHPTKMRAMDFGHSVSVHVQAGGISL